MSINIVDKKDDNFMKLSQNHIMLLYAHGHCTKY